MSQGRLDLGVRVGTGEDHRVGGHQGHRLGRQYVRAGDADEDVSPVDDIHQGTQGGVVGETLLVLVEIGAAAVDHTLAVQHEDVVRRSPALDQQIHAGGGGGTGAHADDAAGANLLALHFQRVEQPGGGDDGGTVLVIVEHRDVAAGDQRLFNLEALGGLDVFQVDAAEGVGDGGHRIDELGAGLVLHLDVDGVDAGKALEQQGLALHHRLGGQRAQIAQPQDGGAVGDDGHQVALAGVTVGIGRIGSDLAYRFGNARAVGQRQIASGLGGLGEGNGDFARDRLGVVVECLLAEIVLLIGHGGPRYGNE